MLSDFPGITAVFPHLLAILLLWLLALAIIRVVKKNALRTAEDIGISNGRIQKTSRVAYGVVTSVAGLLAVVVVLFLTSPLERNYEDMKRITPAEADREFIAPSKEEITVTNEQAVNRRADEKRSEATRDNTQAIEDATRLFQNAADQADVKRNQ